jgi:predicted dehydrogenase
MAKEKVKIGFCGVGGMGQCAHLRNYYTLPDCEVVALAELREKTGKRVAQRYGIPKVYKEAAEMLAAEKLDALVASQPFTRHGVLLPELLKANKPIFIEKPLASSLEAGEKILKALADSGTWIMVGYHKRSDPASMYAKAQVDALKASGEVGNLRYVRILMPAGDWVANGFVELIREDDPNPQLQWDPPASDMDEVAYKAYVGFTNYWIHQVNLLRYLLGEPYRVTYADPSGVLFVAASQSGVAGVIEMTPYRTTVDWQESALVAFEKGYVKLELPAPLASNRPGRVEILRDPGDGKTPEVSSPHLPWVHAMRQQAMNFVAAVRGERKPMCDAAEAFEDLKVAREYLRLWKGV